MTNKKKTLNITLESPANKPQPARLAIVSGIDQNGTKTSEEFDLRERVDLYWQTVTAIKLHGVTK